jgi:hypothetical protein
MSFLILPPSLPPPPPVDQSAATQQQARAVALVPATAVTVSPKQDNSGQAKNDTTRRDPHARQRGRIVDILA